MSLRTVPDTHGSLALNPPQFYNSLKALTKVFAVADGFATGIQNVQGERSQDKTLKTVSNMLLFSHVVSTLASIEWTRKVEGPKHALFEALWPLGLFGVATITTRRTLPGLMLYRGAPGESWGGEICI